MDDYRAFRIEVVDIDHTWQLFTPFRYAENYKQIYLKKIRRLRLACRVLHKFKIYRRPLVEAIEIIPDDPLINNVNTRPKPLFSLKIKCKLQINNWTLDILGLIDTGCSNTILDQQLVPLQYHKPIPPTSQFMAEQMDGQLFTYTTKLDKCKLSFYLPNGTLTNYISIEHKINLRLLRLRHIQFIIGLNLLFTSFQGCLLTPTSLHLLTFPPLQLTSESALKRGGVPCCSPCSKQQPQANRDPLKYPEEHNECLEEYTIPTITFPDEPFEDSQLYSELIEVPGDYYACLITPSYLYNLISSGNLEIDDILSKLAKEEIIGENPGKHWKKNKILCKLELKDPEFRIQNKKIESTNENLKEFELHINELLRLGVIQKSTSRHRSPAFIVNKHSEQVRGKSRMVIDYRRLNDNTVDDAYDIPDKTELLNSIQGSKIFSKFDCKSGFWQIRMHPESIEWTAFTCPLGHFEWLVMPFGLKNAPSIFQRKMDNVFNKYKKFVCVYIDDILVFSKTIEEHVSHLKLILSEFLKQGIIISGKKAQFFRKNIEFLGVEIGDGHIKLQPHIAKKILETPPVRNIKALQQFLGLANYARPFIKNLGKLIGPLYSKLGGTGVKQFNVEDDKQIIKVKQAVTNLPDLKLPLDTDYLIIECDGCEEGWGAILKSKPNKYSPKTEEQICRYGSGQYRERRLTSSIDQEILAVNYALDSFRLFLLNKKEILVRTDCEAIVKFFHNKNSKRISQRRWLAFKDRILNSNYHIIFEHIKGKNNILADTLSRCLFFEIVTEKPP